MLINMRFFFSVTDATKAIIPCQGKTSVFENLALDDIFEDLENAKSDVYAADKSHINQK